MFDKYDHTHFVDVILPVPIQQLFTYHVPAEMDGNIVPGMRVTVEFGKKKLYSALVYKTHEQKPERYETKPVLEVIDDNPIVNEKQFAFWKWIAEYYMCTLGDVFKAALPAGLKLESETTLFLNPEFEANEKLSTNEELIYQVLFDQKSINLSDLNRLMKGRNILQSVKRLLQKKAIFTEEIIKENYRAKTEDYIYLSDEYNTEEKLNQAFDSLNRAPGQLQILMVYLSETQFLRTQKVQSIKKSILLEKSNNPVRPGRPGGKPQALKALVDKGFFKVETREVSRFEKVEVKKGISELNENQQRAFDNIKKQFEDKHSVLLHGVTSSGKTEIYIHLIEETIKQGKQVLYLLPEIALTTQIINRLRNVFGDKVGVYHSKFNDNERVEVYNRTLSGGELDDMKIILGVRSSVFLPFSNLGLIIVDEEHENSYKQYDPAPRYHARDAAIYLAHLHGAKILLGTATPAIETYYNAKTGKYGLVELKERFKDIELPEILVADTKEARRKKQMTSIFTPRLLKNIDTALVNKEQVILFQNRRGYAPFVECQTCNWIPYCKHCDVSLTYHKHTNKAVCHYCGYSISVPKVCNACGNPDLKTKGFGTEKIEDELSVIFPESKVSRMDLDTTRSKKSYERIITNFENKKVDILVGTQMVSKGLDFNNVNTVGIMNADNMLNFPDFRAFERSFQLMAQVSGRAGRRNKQGKVIIQTSDPNHPVILDVIRNNYKSMFLKQLDERQKFKYPPFYRLIYLKLKAKERVMLDRCAKQMAEQLQAIFGGRVLGPEYPVINRVQNWYQKNILIKVETEKSQVKAKQLINKVINEVLAKQEFRAVRVLPDVDPM